MNKTYNTIIIGAGAAGMMAAITSANSGKRVLLLEKLSSIGMKLKATGGGRCNLTNTLNSEDFMASFGRNGRFMTKALDSFDNHSVIEFFDSIGVKTKSSDGFRVFPDTHSSTSVINGLKNAMDKLDITIICDYKVDSLKSLHDKFTFKNIIIATGGKGYPTLGAEGDGYELAKEVGHTVTSIFPAMTPLKTKEDWVRNCRADTIAKVHMIVDMKKHKKLTAVGDLIFTKDGIRGPVVLDFAREITPLLERYGEVPILVNMTKGLNEEQIREKFKENPTFSTLGQLQTLLPTPLSLELCTLAGANPDLSLKQLKGEVRDRLIKLLVWTPLTITDHEGFDKAMITRGGINLKEIDPNTMKSKLVDGLYFCGEVMDLDGPCGGYNLQWSFSSGYLAGLSL